MPHARDTQRLLDAIQRLSFARDLDGITTAVRQEVRALTRADGVTFVLRDGEFCHYVAEDAIGPLWQGRRFPLSACISGWVMTRAETAVIPDIYQDERIPHDAYRPTFVRSLVMVPVRRESPVAAIGIYWARPYRAEQEVPLLESVANAASVALANVSLYDELAGAVERERRARQEAEASARLKDEFLATVSHELRTPLNVIQGWAWQLQQENLPPDIRKRALDAVQRNVHLQARLVEDLLSATYASAGTLRLHLRPVDLTAVCETMPDMARGIVEAQRLTLHVHCAETATIHGDPERIQQIVWNLISNAVKFTPAGGEVHVSVSSADGYARLTVRDTGVGIPPEFLERVFDPFRQADTGLRRRFPGLGLGLHIVKLLVDLHGGRIRVESGGNDCGTTAIVEFPDATRALQPARPTEPDVSPP
jgi:signal transduction histidine kinase